jgi:formyl-CoA transferase/CoA:oxalate CoA-transferase
LQLIFETASSLEWVRRFVDAGIPAAAIHTVPDALSDEQTRKRGLIVELEHPVLGAVKSIANPIRLSRTPITYRLPPPFLGEHTNAILSELAYSVDEIEAARADFAI